jgi:sugar phosphate isomerase/epimerase
MERREMLARSAAALAVAAGPTAAMQAAEDPSKETGARHPFRYALNTSTIRGQSLSLTERIDIAAQAGYSGIEPWIREIDEYVAAGGTLADLAKRIADLGLTVDSVIGFCEWIVDDDARRAKGLEEARRNMEQVRAIGGTRIAAPPVGATEIENFDLRRAAERYRELLVVGEQFGVAAQVEVWGFSKTLGRLSEATFVAVESGHPQACVLPDVYHLYKGGSSPEGLRLLNGAAMHAFHFNDYPAEPPRAEITDAARVFPGDGVAPLALIVRELAASGFRGSFSLELFNRDYWQRDALDVARIGLAKMRAVVEQSLKT